MNNFYYGLKEEDYTWKNAFLWGNCIGHFRKLNQGRLEDRIVHFFIALAELPPIIGQIASLFEKVIVTASIKSVPPVLKDEYQEVLKATPACDFCRFYTFIPIPESYFEVGDHFSEMCVTPKNLFFEVLLKDTRIYREDCSQEKYFCFNQTPQAIHTYCKKKHEREPDMIVSLTAKNKEGEFSYHNENWEFPARRMRIIRDLSEVYGDKVYKISLQEIVQDLDSQKTHLSSMLPQKFYEELIKRMNEFKDGLPKNCKSDSKLSELIKNETSVGTFLKEVEAKPAEFGFASVDAFREFLDFKICQISWMVVKSEEYRVFINGDGKIKAREPGQRDSIRLISACGDTHAKKTEADKTILTEIYKAAFQAIENGIVAFSPMSRRGNYDPELYWEIFFDALVNSNVTFDKIFVNPRHVPHHEGKYKGLRGEEFQKILGDYLTKYKNNKNILEKLNKIVNLFDTSQDIFQLAHNLKVAFPEKTVSLFNITDPELTLGFEVEENIRNMT